MAQQLDWQVGDKYATEQGPVMVIIGELDGTLLCDGGHNFDLRGNQTCLCVHGNLVSRVTGSVRA